MPITLLHQCGHNTVWNKDSMQEDGCGDGLILSPVHQSYDVITQLDPAIKAKSFFDPQFYLPNSQKAKLNSYSFFPEAISEGFVTSDFSLIALDAARECTNFQISQGFIRLIIPARYSADMVTNFTDMQDAYTVHPFLQAIEEANYEGPVFLTLPLTRGMIMDDAYRTQILNWVTSYPRVNGVYILVSDGREAKQIQDFEYLKKYLVAVKELSDAGLVVTVGHSNTEGLLFTLIEGCEVTFGAYENTRMFSVDKFVVTDEERRGPRARIYLNGLLNWIQYPQAKQLQEDMASLWGKIYLATPYGDRALSAVKEPSFNSPELYKHHFMTYQAQINALKLSDLTGRYQRIRDWLREADDYYHEIEARPIDLERNGRGTHIQPWLDAVNWYYANYLAS